MPRVIVVGGKSAGKSSLLEMITKCPIFPRHSDFCTKMPIKLQLKRVSTAAQNTVSLTFQGKSTKLELTEILPEIDKIMQKLEHAVAEPIVVEICKVSHTIRSYHMHSYLYIGLESTMSQICRAPLSAAHGLSK